MTIEARPQTLAAITRVFRAIAFSCAWRSLRSGGETGDEAARPLWHRSFASRYQRAVSGTLAPDEIHWSYVWNLTPIRSYRTLRWPSGPRLTASGLTVCTSWA